MLVDCGANAECTVEYLVQFAYLGSFYAAKALGMPFTSSAAILVFTLCMNMPFNSLDGEGDAFVSAGSTGALLSAGTLLVKRIRGIRRAAMAPSAAAAA